MIGWLTAFAGTVDIESGAIARGGDTATSPTTGVQVDVPAGYTAQLAGESLQITGPGPSLELTAHSGLTLTAAEAATRNGLLVGLVPFQASAAPVLTGSTLTVELSGTGLGGGKHWGIAGARVVGNQTAVLFATGSAADQASTARLFQQVWPTVLGTGKPSTTPNAPVSQAGGRWASALGGQQVQLYARSADTTHTTRVDLCSDGTAWFTVGSSYASSDGAYVSGAARAANQGTWSVSGNRITTHWSDGSEDSRKLSMDPSGALFLDGERWLRTASERCR